MTDAQYRTALVFARAVADLFGGGDIECVRAHGETNGRGGDGKWDPGFAPGQTIDMAAFRKAAATTTKEDDLSAEDTELLKQILNQLTGSREAGKFPGYAHRRYGKPAGNFTLVDYLREIDRQVNSNLDLKNRPGAETDDLLGHVLSLRADQKGVSVELTDEQAEQINTQVGAIVESKLDEVAGRLGLSKDDVREVLREVQWVTRASAGTSGGTL